MKNLMFLIAFTLFSYQTIASNEAYKKIMKEKITEVYNTKSLESYQSLANDFERISQKEDKEWLPLYYAAYCYINMGFTTSLSLEEKDKYFQQANDLIKKASGLSPENSEIIALKGYSKMGELSADAANRGQSLSPQVMQLLGKAIAVNKNNPRALFLMAQMEYGMAQFFGSSTENACNYAKRSVTLYENEQTQELEPSWGANAAASMASRCQ